MENSNLPPFYVGQKVVHLKNLDVLPKGTVVTVHSLFQCNCGEWNFQYGVSRPASDKPKKATCPNCKKNIIELIPNLNNWAPQCRNFAPVQEQMYPLVSLSKVVEETHELVSAN